MFQHSRVFHVQAYQLYEALHDHFTCPFSHNEKAKSYIPRSECPRRENLLNIAYTLLEKADGIEFRPFSPGRIEVGGESFEQMAIEV